MAAQKKALINKNKKYKIAIIDDHPIVRYGIGQLINEEKDLSCCAEAGDTVKGSEIIKNARPDLAIIDLSLNGVNAIDFIKSLSTRYPKLPILVISIHDENLYAERVLRAGAKGYIMKQEATEKVIEAIRKILNGELYISEEVSINLINKFYTKSRPGTVKTTPKLRPVELLSDRELEVFRLTGKGFGVKEIAQSLNLSVRTIETYRQKAKQKLNLKSTSELTKYAIEMAGQSLI